jgi:chemosensory pili system protein ChpA (sensor histidine kinase/response regulator)
MNHDPLNLFDDANDLTFLSGGQEGPSQDDWSKLDLALNATFVADTPKTAASVALSRPEEVERKETAQAPSSETGIWTLDVERSGLDMSVLEIFLDEATQQVAELKKEWATLSTLAHVDAKDLLVFKRSIHTFKGSAGMIQANKLHALSHDLETDLDDIEEGRLDWEEGKETVRLAVNDILEWVRWIQTPEHVPMFQSKGVAEKGHASAFVPKAEDQKEAGVAENQPAQAKAVEGMVRLRAKSVDALLQEIGVWGDGQTSLRAQNVFLKNALKDMEEGVERMQRLLKEVQISAEAQISARRTEMEEVGGHFDPLEMDRFTRLQESTRIMAEGVDDLSGLHGQIHHIAKQTEDILQQQARGVRAAQEVVTEARLVPLDAISGKLRKIVALAAKETQKQIRLEFVGDDIRVDRAVLEKLVAPLEHLLRNAVVHGIESASVRAQHQKPEVGTIWIEAQPREDTLVLACRDDGAGVNTERVREKAVEKGWLSKNDNTPDHEVNLLIFRPGFSTAEKVSGLAGRGVGMDVVKTEVEQLGGQIQMVSTPGTGSVFLLEVPLTIATTQALIVSASDEEWALPAQHVKQVHSIRDHELKAAYQTQQFQGGRLFHLSDLLSPKDMHPRLDTYNTVIEFTLGDRTLFIQVDKLLATEDVVIRPLTKPISLVQGFGGTAYLGEGRIGLLLQPFALLARKDRTQEALRDRPLEVVVDVVQQRKSDRLTAMVVDDSLTVRKVTGDLLRNKGIRVILAKDGIDALEQLQNELPDILLVDLEMPRMNGFELVEHVRNTPKFSHLPVVMITSRTSEKHQETARSIGVNAHLGKPYQENELMAQIAHWTKHPSFSS